MPDLKGSRGRRFTLREMDDWDANASVEAQARHGGVSAVQKMAGLRAAEETRLNQQRITRYKRLHEGAVQGLSELSDWCDAALREVESACVRMRQTGDPSEVLQTTIRRLNMAPRVVAAVEELAKDAAAADGIVDMDVADFQDAEVERFPGLANALPFVTDEWLANDPKAPAPFGGAS